MAHFLVSLANGLTSWLQSQCKVELKANRIPDRQTDGQTKRQTDRLAERQAGNLTWLAMQSVINQVIKMRRNWYPAKWKLPTAVDIILQQTIIPLSPVPLCCSSYALHDDGKLHFIRGRQQLIILYWITQQNSADWQAESSRDMHKQAQTGTHRQRA